MSRANFLFDTEKNKYSELLSENSNFFVYGTLKRGYGNNRILEGSTFMGNTFTKDKFRMYKWGFPMIVSKEYLPEVSKKEFKPVYGEVFNVQSWRIFEDLDHLEGEGTLFHRSLLDLTNGDTAWAYQMKYDCSDYDSPDCTQKEYWAWP